MKKEKKNNSETKDAKTEHSSTEHSSLDDYGVNRTTYNPQENIALGNKEYARIFTSQLKKDQSGSQANLVKAKSKIKDKNTQTKDKNNITVSLAPNDITKKSQTDNIQPPKPHYHGHRNRLRERFVNSGVESLQDYELIELLLFRSIPRRDVKPIAKQLISQFGNIKNIFCASPKELATIKGLSKNIIIDLKLIFAACLKIQKQEIIHSSIINSWQALISYLKTSMGYLGHEELRALFLNKKLILIKDEVLQTGTTDNTPFYPREIIKRAIDLSASALIIVHNHPSGDPTPSLADINVTKQLIKASRALNIKIIDHIIISNNKYVSFKTLQLLED